MAKSEKVPASQLVKEFINKTVTSSDRTAHNVYIGIDPGANGAIGILIDEHSLAIDIPALTVKRKGGTKTVFNYQEIIKVFALIKGLKASFISVHVALEQGVVMVKGKGSNAYTGFRVGCAYGMWPLFIHGCGLPLEEFHPTAWKNRMGINSDKENSRHKAISMFPDADLALKQDHDRAEALLLAEHLRRTLTGAGEQATKSKKKQ